MLDSIGRVHWRMGEMQKALEYYGQTLSLSRAVKDRREEAGVLSNMGLVYSQLGEPRRALEYFEQSLLLKREMGDRQEEAYTLVNIGNVYISLGELQKTLTYYGQALQSTAAAQASLCPQARPSPSPIRRR